MFSWIFFDGFQFKDFVKIPYIPFDFSPIFAQENLLGRACRPPIFPQNAHPQVTMLNTTTGWRPTNGGRPFVLVPSLYIRRSPWEEWDPVDLVQKQE